MPTPSPPDFSDLEADAAARADVLDAIAADASEKREAGQTLDAFEKFLAERQADSHVGKLMTLRARRLPFVTRRPRCTRPRQRAARPRRQRRTRSAATRQVAARAGPDDPGGDDDPDGEPPLDRRGSTGAAA